MALLRTQDEVTGLLCGSVLLLATSQWSTPQQNEADGVEVSGPWRQDRVGPVSIEWQADRPRHQGAESAYPLTLAAARVVVLATRRTPPFLVIVDLSSGTETYLEVARVSVQGIDCHSALFTRTASALARAVEQLSTDDAEPVYYLGREPFPVEPDSKLAALVLPLAATTSVLKACLLRGTNSKSALRLVWLNARQRTLALSVLGVGLWFWSATQWWQTQAVLERFGPGVLQSELRPLKDRLRTAKNRATRLEQTFASAKAEHLASRKLSGMLQRSIGPGASIQRVQVTNREKLTLFVEGKPAAVLSALARLEQVGRLGNLRFTVQTDSVTTTETAAVPVDIQMRQEKGREQL
ncbi:MAG: hypothetical protein H7Y22_06030 [Gemmatimonadaceae bacterium]|nr:hypothetical protein [Gloeobacterales cyanobacterium ES-bin-141]